MSQSAAGPRAPLPLHWKILIGMILGLLAGLAVNVMGDTVGAVVVDRYTSGGDEAPDPLAA